MDSREVRRFVGYMAARLPDIGAERLTDPRRRSSIRWRLSQIIHCCVVGMACGARGLGGMERKTGAWAHAVLSKLGVRGRLPDTTARDVLVQLDPDEVRQGLHRVILRADRRKAIDNDALPPGIVSMDGKATAIPVWDDHCAQKQSHSSALGAHGLVRTVTSCLISSAACPCIDAYPIPAETNEVGVYQRALDALLAAYGRSDLVRVVLYDAGACSEANARYTRGKGVHYVLVLNGAQPTLYAEAKHTLGSLPLEDADHVSEDPRDGGTWKRYVFLSEALAGWLDWDHLQTVARLVSIRSDKNGREISREERYYVSSLPRHRLGPAQWNLLIRRRWAVENECHHTFDTAFAEDRHPWIVAHPRGMLVVLLLRRIAYSLLAFFRSVTLRSETSRTMPWAELMEKLFIALVTARHKDLAGLRARHPAADLLA